MPSPAGCFMSMESVTQFVAVLCEHQLLEPFQLDLLTFKLRPRFDQVRTLAEELERRGWLTAYQIEQILQGHGRDLVVGPYQIQDRLGQGGVSQVFRAVHTFRRAVVALKILRPEHRDNLEALNQFRMEMRAVMQLNHPNIIKAVDVNPAGAAHFFALEYIEGTDLAKLIGQARPLPVAQACDYIRQTALGLQHAYERGLVHRDIKPSNLVITEKGTRVKILDMGLARMEWLPKEDTSVTPITRSKAVVMGTPDYMAPEQATDPETADIRADIYSLGCTLYHVLTGRPPFPDCSLAQKLLRHQQTEPLPVEEQRADLPAGLPLVARKMMAKRADDRYQTPAAVAAALAPFCRGATALVGASRFKTGNPSRSASQEATERG